MYLEIGGATFMDWLNLPPLKDGVCLAVLENKDSDINSGVEGWARHLTNSSTKDDDDDA